MTRRLALLTFAAFVALPARGLGQEYDLIIRGGRLLDGTGAADRVADLGIRDERISAIGDLGDATARRVIDAEGMYVAPGFIDIHSHGDWSLSLPGLNVALNDLTQGITTVVVGQDGRQAWPIGGDIRQTIDDWTARGLGLNSILLTGHGTVRQEVMLNEDRAPTAEELERMKARVREAMEGGAWGISTGLSYTPGRFGDTEEVIALTAEVRPYGGFYISHLRNQSDRLMESIEETVRIGRETGVPVVATHFKSSGRQNFGKAKAAMARIAQAREDGVPIWADVYPWTTSSDGIDISIVPGVVYAEVLQADEELMAAREAVATAMGSMSKEELIAVIRGAGGFFGRLVDPEFLASLPEATLLDLANANVSGMLRGDRRLALRRALEDPEKRADIHESVARAVYERGPDLYVVEKAPDPRLAGLNLAQAARVMGLDVVDAAIEIDLMDTQVTRFHMSDEDVEEILSWPFVAIGTDGTIPYFGAGVPHPRSYGTFTHLIRHYVFDQGVLTLAEAIHRSTGLTAEIIGIEDRGYLREGLAADVVVFDPFTIQSCSNYTNPHCYSRGIEYLVVNGQLTLDEGSYTGVLGGRILTPRGAIATTTSGS
ncbi:MAG: amidohydrolase family protein [Gemmatimonadales bacterium]|jgi:N-acyl-D-aspartate/D-glutamate deacylase